MNNKAPKVSIIVPVYNRETMIEECINSILQSEFHDFEVIIIDDGSTDGTSQICRRMADSDNRIKYVYQHNGGVSAARNHGLKLCQGEWVTFVDSDDIILPFHLNVINMANDANMLMTDCAYSLPSIEKLNQNTPPIVSDNAAEYLYDKYDPYSNPVFAVWNKFFRLKILKEQNILFYENLSLGEDRLFISNYLLHANTILHFKQKSYIQVCHENSLVHTLRSPADYMKVFHLNYLAICKLIHKSNRVLEYATNYGISQPIIWILYQYTENKNYKLLKRNELEKFTKAEIIPFISSIDTSQYNAKRWHERLVRWILLHMGAKVTIRFCRSWNVVRSSSIMVKSFIQKVHF